ncbi:MAG: hypothetical protein ACRDZU_00015 [Acidimicrobiales bacterium]
MRTRSVAVAAALALVAAGACSSSSDGGDEPDPDVTGAPTAAGADVPEVPPPSPAGTGVIVVGGTRSSFAVTACRLEPDPTQPEGARALVEMDGAGTTGSGVPFTIEVQRFATGTDVITYTDTITYSDTGRILQAQRIEVAGQVTDLRDPKASSALLRTRADGLSAAGLAGGPGDGPEDEGIIGLALDATCS